MQCNNLSLITLQTFLVTNKTIIKHVVILLAHSRMLPAYQAYVSGVMPELLASLNVLSTGPVGLDIMMFPIARYLIQQILP